MEMTMKHCRGSFYWDSLLGPTLMVNLGFQSTGSPLSAAGRCSAGCDDEQEAQQLLGWPTVLPHKLRL